MSYSEQVPSSQQPDFFIIHPQIPFLLTCIDSRCTMRIGKGIHPDGVPGWCQGFSLDGGRGVRAVKVIQHGNRPGLIYNIGKLLHPQQAKKGWYEVS